VIAGGETLKPGDRVKVRSYAMWVSNTSIRQPVFATMVISALIVFASCRTARWAST